jgi:hypothetical protein
VLLGLLSQTFLGSIGLPRYIPLNSTAVIYISETPTLTLSILPVRSTSYLHRLTDDSTSHLQSNPVVPPLAGDHLVSARAPKGCCHVMTLVNAGYIP